MKRFTILSLLSVGVAWLLLGVFVTLTWAMNIPASEYAPHAPDTWLFKILHAPTQTNQSPISVTWQTTISGDSAPVSTTLWYQHNQQGWFSAELAPSSASSGTFAFMPPAGDGHYAFTTTAYTATTANFPQYYTGDVTTTFDTTPPIVALLTPGHISATHVNLAWEIRDEYVGVLSYTIEYSPTGTGQWEVLRGGANPATIVISAPFVAETDTWYTFRATAEDNLGNRGVSDIQMYVGPFKLYLPLALRNYANIPFTNGDFETGALAPWQKAEDAVPVRLAAGDPEINGGAHSVLLGDPTVSGRGDAPVGNGRIWQTFSIPQIQDTAWITIQYHIVSQDIVRGSTNDYFDSFEIYLNTFPDVANQPSKTDMIRAVRCDSELGQPIVPTESYTNSLIFCDGRASSSELQDLGWRSVKLDLSAYKGQVVTLYLANFSRWDGWDNTYTYIDNVEVNW